MIRMFLVLMVLSVVSICFSALDKPDGFASVSGKGLQTTTGGERGQTVTVTNWNDLVKYATAEEPFIILIKGGIKAPQKGAEISLTDNKTIVGLGDDATLHEAELKMMYISNIIIRNITVRDSYVEGDHEGKENDFDGIQADGTHHLWVDHCHFTHCGDGLIDLRKVCDYVTISWVELSNHNKAFGIGWTEENDYRITIHHTYFNETETRNPSFDMGFGHLYNNYVKGSRTYGHYSRGEVRMIIENCLFENCNTPIKIDGTSKCYISGVDYIGNEGPTEGNVSAPPYDLASYYTYKLDPVDEVQKIVSEGVGPKAYIGEQYLNTKGALKNERLSTERPGMRILKNNSNILTVTPLYRGACDIIIANVAGKVIGTYKRNKPTVTISIPGNGIYIITIVDSKTNDIIKSKRFVAF